LSGFQLGESYLMLFMPPMTGPLQLLVPNPAVVFQIVQTVADLFQEWELLLDDSHVKPELFEQFTIGHVWGHLQTPC
jgi:hypothetical protein